MSPVYVLASNQRTDRRHWAIAALGASVILGLQISANSQLALPFALAPLASIAIKSPSVRAWAVIVVAVFALGGQGLDLQKFGFLVLLAPAVFGGWAALRDRPEDRRLRIAAAIGVAGVVLAACVGVVRGNGVIPVGRDGLTYLLLAAIPILGADFARVSRPRLEWVLLVGGWLSSVAFWLTWSSRRGIIEADYQGLFMNGRGLGTALFCYSIARIVSGDRRWRWLAATAGCFALPLLSGTRGVFLLLLAPIAILSVAEIGARRRVLSLTLLATIGLSVLSVGLGAAQTAGEDDPVALAFERVSTTTSALDRPFTDASAVARIEQWKAGSSDFVSSGGIGQGLGHVFYWEHPWLPLTRSVTSMDTPLAALAKLGLLSSLAVGVGLAVTLRRPAMMAESHAQTAIIGMLAVIAAGGLLSNTFEDKGVALGLALLVGLRRTSALGDARLASH